MSIHALQHATEGCAHLFGVLEILEQRLLVPCYALVDVGGGVGEALSLTGLAAEDTARLNLEDVWNSKRG